MKKVIESLKTGRRKVFFDMCLNIIAAALPLAMLQLIVYPRMASILGGDEYGLMLTIYSVWIMVSNSLGNVLNNIKLLRFPEYQELGEEGDISLLLWKWIGASSVIVFVAIWIYHRSFTPEHLLFGTAVSLFILLKAYLEVGFRIKLNYLAILLSNALLSVGFFVGFFLFRITKIWELVFLVGYMPACIFCIFKTGLLKETVKKTLIYKAVRKDAYSLLMATVITNMINYADKLVLYPLMGGTAVSIYYTATILGKITGMLTGPINSVVLSYITRWDKSRASIFTKILMLGTMIAAISYVLTLVVARPIIGMLFPQWVDNVMEIIPLTTITIMLTVLTSFLNPFVLKFCKMQWQIAISAIGSGVYFFCALLLWSAMGLKGFCLGTIIGALVKIAVMIIVYYRNMKKQNETV